MLGQMFRFIITGLINTIIDFGTFNLLIAVTGVTHGIFLVVINMLAIGLAATNSYFMNRSFTFPSGEPRHQKQIQRFIIATGSGMLINSLVVFGASRLTAVLALSYWAVLNLGKLLGAVLSTTWNFLFYRNWVFKPRDNSRQLIEEQEYIPGLTSVIIPAFNEANRLPARLEELAATLPSFFPVEIIVVDDGSTDSTFELALAAAERYPFISCCSYEPNQGKGKAVRTGIQAAKGEYLLFTDADNSFTPDHIRTLAESLHQGSPVAIACRESYSELNKGEFGLRYLMGRTFNRMVQWFLLPGLFDTQCGLKGFHHSAANRIFALQQLDGFAFDVEILALARAMQMEIHQVPVQVTACPGSRVNQWLDPIYMTRDIGKIKLSFLTNHYGIPGGNRFMHQLLLTTGLFAVALALRLPWLWDVPRFVDELKEVKLAYQIYLGQVWPLHNAAHDIGAMHNYILAGIFSILGPGIYWPRLYVACLSALTVIVVYRLGKRLYGHYAGLIAAVLLMFNGMHILVSHMAWANCTTPLFFSLALLATINAEQQRSGKWLVMAALLWAATLQTHSSVIIYILLVLIYVLSPGFRRRSSISLRWYLYGTLAFLVGYANMIYYNLITLGGSIRWLSNKSYAMEQHLTIMSYLQNLAQMAIELLRTLSSTYSQQVHLWQYLISPFLTLALILLVYGSYLALKQKDIRTLPFWLMTGTTLLMPLINKRYVFYVSTRYIMPIFICALVIMAYALQQILQQLYLRNKESKIFGVTVAASLLMVAVLQYLPYANYCTSHLNTNASNRLALEVVATTREMASGKNSLVLLDSKIPIENKPLPYLLTLASQPYRELKFNSASLNTDGQLTGQQAITPNGCDRLIAVLSAASYHNLINHTQPYRVTCLTSRVISSSATHHQRKIYVLEWDLTPNHSAKW